MQADYRIFLKSAFGAQWKKLGIKRRAGLVTPLFSVHSKKSVGVGEIPDLELLAGWCRSAGLSLIQLLPMNDVGFTFTPYDSSSSFALEPMHLSLERLAFVPVENFKREIAALKKSFPIRPPRFNTGIKKAKLELLFKMFGERRKSGQKAFTAYAEENRSWINSYARFKVLKAQMQERSWEQWPQEFKSPAGETLRRFDEDNRENLEFHSWLQWQLCLQFAQAKKAANAKGVFFIGDLPFLVSRDSADVWANQAYFKLDLSTGAPPDLYFADGQEWGMPPYDWPNIAAAGYDYLKEKLRYASRFYDLFRIDHFVGVFRVWTLVRGEQDRRRAGRFDPADEAVWESHGRALVEEIAKTSRMLPCAEDLGTVPVCSNKILEEFAIPGMEVQRWTKDWAVTHDFKRPEEYRKNSIAAISTHDMPTLENWWEVEAESVDEADFRNKCACHGVDLETVKDKLFDLKESKRGRLRWKKGLDGPVALAQALGKREEDMADVVGLYLNTYGEREKFWRLIGMSGPVRSKSSARFVQKCLAAANATASIFSIQLLQDWLAAGSVLGEPDWDYRINCPGTVNDKNWRLVLPLSLEQMQKLPLNKTLKAINLASDRI